MNKKISKKEIKLNFETANVSRDELALFLLNTAHKVRLVNRKIKDFSSHQHFSVIYNREELTELLNITIAKVINSHEAYILKCKGLPIPEIYPAIGDELDLSSFGNIIGYMRSAYDNNISKDYKKHIATKRSANVISYDSANQDSSDDNKQGNAILNLLYENSIDVNQDTTEYKRLMNEILVFLKTNDRKINKGLSRKNTQVKEEKKSKLSYLFIYLLDPKYKGKFVFIKDKLPEWTQYLYKKNKEELALVIKSNFPDSMEFLYDYLNNSYDSYGETLSPKQTPNYYDQSCDVSTCFNYVFKQDKVQVEFLVQLFRLNNGEREILESEVSKIIVDKNDVELAKGKLNAKMSGVLIKMKETASSRKHNSLKEIYGNVA